MKPRRLLPVLGFLLALTATPALIYSISKRATPEIESPFRNFGASKPDTVCTALAAQMESFRAESLTLAPTLAAAKWLGLCDSFFQNYPTVRLSHNYSTDRIGMKVDLENLFQSLPPTASWDAIAAGLKQRATTAKPAKAASLRLLASLLGGDQAALKTSLEAVKNLPKSIYGRSGHVQKETTEAVDEILAELAVMGGRQEDVIAAFENRLKSREDSHSFGSDLMVPDLLRHMPEENAAPLILKALLTKSGCEVVGPKTRRLAARLALENVDKLKTPAWNLVGQPEDIPLYEALLARFGSVLGAGYDDKNQADRVYLLLLIADGRTENAVAFVQKRHAPTPAKTDKKRPGNDSEDDFFRLMSEESPNRAIPLHPDSIEALRRQGLGRKAFDFLKALLESDPSLPYWENFIKLSAHVKASDEALVFLRAALSKTTLTGSSLEEVRGHLAAALLAADQPAEAVTLLRQNLAAPLPQTATGEQLKELAQNRYEQALRLALIGKLLQQPELIKTGLEAARALVLGDGRENLITSSYQIEHLTKFYTQLGQATEAESLLRGLLAKARTASTNARQGFSTVRGSDSNELLAQLCAVLSHQGKHAEVIRLLDEAPEWGKPDLGEVRESSFGDHPFLVTAAKAFAETGRKPLASKILRHHLMRSPGDDPAYSLLLSLNDGDITAFLDKVAARHRFQERPLIWKARLLLDSGNPLEAEKIIREAIAIDPSDGEQGKGDRMRAYAILGEILELKGDNATAAIMRGAIQSIRLSEEADDWWQAGLLSRAVALYEKALTLFADAYCIQSRLALRYSEQGDYAKAEKHYRRAFELMPDSFGRVESHCFGCEGAFTGERAQNIAEKVFSELALKMPDKAQVFYLLGYLRSQQKRHAEAAEALRRAVKLDPDYINAWKKLADLNSHIALPASELNHIRLQLFRLDPEGYEGRKVGEISDLRQLWDILLATEKQHPPLGKEALYPLAASAQKIKADKRGDRDSRWSFDHEKEDSPRSILAQNEVLRKSLHIVETLDSLDSAR